MKGGLRVLRALLTLYPRSFRVRNGGEWLAMAQAVLSEPTTGGTRVSTWIRLIVDTMAHATAAHMSEFKESEGIMGPFFTDLRQAARTLFRRKGFTAMSAFTLSIGIAAVTTVFSLFHAVLLRPLPFPEQDQLVTLWHLAPGLRSDEINQSPASFLLYKEHNQVFSHLGLWDNGAATINGIDRPERIGVLRVTEGLLPTLGFPTQLGRPFSEEDDRPGAPLTVVLNHDYWQERFGGGRDVLGRMIQVSGEPAEVIGVLEAGFPFPRTSMLLPARFDPARVHNGDFSYQIIARLGEGVSLDQARQDLDRILPRLATDYQGNLTEATLRDGEFRAHVKTLREDFVGDVEASLWVLLGLVGMVLMIACANVGNLFLVFSEGRTQEVALKTALGATRGRVFRTLLVESGLIALLGAVAGVALASVAVRVTVAFGPELLSQLPGFGLNASVLGFSLLCAALSGLLFAIPPLLRFQRQDRLNVNLKAGAAGSGTARDTHRTRNVLVVAQVAMAATLLVTSGLMVRSYRSVQAVAPGFTDAESLYTVRISLPERTHPTPAEVGLTHDAISRQLEGLQGVSSVSASSSVTMDGRDSHNQIVLESFPPESGALPPVFRVKFVAGEYHETLGIDVLRGRQLTEADLTDHARVAVVSETLAGRYWSDPADAIGERLGFESGEWWEIVGVTAEVHDDGLHAAPVPIAYFPATGTWREGSPFAQRTLTHVLRFTGALDGGAAIREAVWAVDPTLPVTDLQTHDQVVRSSLEQTAFATGLLIVTGLIALVLGTVGMYSVVSYLVALRTREFGVRVALGAEPSTIGQLVLRRGGALLAVGVPLGLLGAFGVGTLMATVLIGVSPHDPLTYLSVTGVLVAVTLLATWVPARRATRVDPVVALSGE